MASCRIEGGTNGFAFSSGIGATTTVLHTLKPGDHVLCGDDVYGGTFRLLDKIMKPNALVDLFGFSATYPGTRPGAAKAGAGK